jgi:hypothetical protein
MMERKHCKDCSKPIKGKRGLQYRTLRCIDCARLAKNQQSRESRPYADYRDDNRDYMQAYRKMHPALSTRYVRRFRQKKLLARTEEADSPHPPSTSWVSKAAIILIVNLFIFPVLSRGAEINLENVRSTIERLEIIIVELTGLVVILTFCCKHIADIWRRKDK